MRAVGFTVPSFFSSDDLVRESLTQSPDRRLVYGHGAEDNYIEYYKMYGKSIGIVARGFLDGEEKPVFESYEPYAISDNDLEINKYIVEHVNNQPIVVFEDIGTGNELVFKLHNKIDFYKNEKAFIDYGRSVAFSRERGIIKRKINLTALSIYGSVILPVYKCLDNNENEEELSDEEAYYKSLVLRYNEGDEDAFEILKLYASENIEILNERLRDEDFLTVVEGYFLPIENSETEYSILGAIKNIDKTYNELTNEEILKLTLDITGSKVQLFINSKDIIGYPMIGMRFMGICQLAGSVILK